MDDICESKQFQSRRNHCYSCPVYGSIHNWNIAEFFYDFRIKTHFADLPEENIISLFSDYFYLLLFSIELNIIYRSYFPYFINYPVIMRGYNLSSIIPVRFISVILGRIMRSGNNDATLTFIISDSERKFRCGTQGFKKIDFKSVR